MTKATEDQLNTLHKTVAMVLNQAMLDDEVSPVMVSIAAKFLKDNNISASIKDNDDMTDLSKALEAKREKRKLRIVPGD